MSVKTCGDALILSTYMCCLGCFCLLGRILTEATVRLQMATAPAGLFLPFTIFQFFSSLLAQYHKTNRLGYVTFGYNYFVSTSVYTHTKK